MKDGHTPAEQQGEVIHDIDYPGLAWIQYTMDMRSPQQIRDDEFWLKETVMAIIQRRKEKELQCQVQAEQNLRND